MTEPSKYAMAAAHQIAINDDLDPEFDEDARDDIRLNAGIIDEAFAPLLRERDALRNVCSKAADTFGDFARTLKILNHFIAAQAAELAEQSIRAALQQEVT
jgi:hypothetical protein